MSNIAFQPGAQPEPTNLEPQPAPTIVPEAEPEFTKQWAVERINGLKRENEELRVTLRTLLQLVREG